MLRMQVYASEEGVRQGLNDIFITFNFLRNQFCYQHENLSLFQEESLKL